MLPKIDSTAAPQSFTVTSGALRVTDPCYDMETWCSGQVENVKNGAWQARVGYHKDLFDMEMAQRHLQHMRDELEAEKKTLKETLIEQGKSEEFQAEMVARWFAHREPRIKEYEEGLATYAGRVAYIQIAHQDHADELENFDPASYSALEDVHVGVDSGQAGFFDLTRYADAVSDKPDDGGRNRDGGKFDAFYGQVCKLTYDERNPQHPQFGTLEWGVASSSGYGDGGYQCYVKRNDAGELIAAFILFIGAHDEDEGADEDGLEPELEEDDLEG